MIGSVCGLAAVMSCNTPTGSGCLDRNALLISITDSVSGMWAAPGATLVVRHAAAADTIRYSVESENLPTPIGLGFGKFDVFITKPGYRDWMRVGITVPEDLQCPSIPQTTTSVIALLQPVPPAAAR